MKRLFHLLTLPLLVLAMVTGLAACGHHRHDPEEKAEWIAKKITRKLDLNEEQKAKLDAVTNTLVQHHKTRHETHKQMMGKLIEQVEQPALDQALLNSMVQEHHNATQQIAPEVIAKLADFHASLDSEQKATLAKKLKKFQKYHSDDDE